MIELKSINSVLKTQTILIKPKIDGALLSGDLGYGMCLGRMGRAWENREKKKKRVTFRYRNNELLILKGFNEMRYK